MSEQHKTRDAWLRAVFAIFMICWIIALCAKLS